MYMYETRSRSRGDIGRVAMSVWYMGEIYIHIYVYVSIYIYGEVVVVEHI